MSAHLALLLAAGVSMGCSASGAMHPGDGGANGDAVVIVTTPFDVAPGQEVFMCQDFANPFGGADAEIQEIESNMTPGSHHMLLFYETAANNSGAATPCDALQFSALPYGAQLPHNSVTFPPGLSALVKGAFGFHMQMHYLNATTSTLKAQITVTFHRATPGTVTQHAGVFFFNNVSGISVPGGKTLDVTQSCYFAHDVNVIYATAHTHRFTNSFSAGIGGHVVYSTTSWDASPNENYAPPLAIKAGTPLTWTCNITNPSTDPANVLTFGESALTNDMCIFDGQYYPADDTSPTVDCMK